MNTGSALAFPINGTRESTAWHPQKFRYWYDNIIDLLLVDPSLSQKDIAHRLGRHAASIGLIMNSDLFRARYEQRRGAHSDQLKEKINGKLTDVAITALGLVKEQLDLKRTTIPLPELADVADQALSRLGYGAKDATSAPGSLTVNVGHTISTISREDLEASRKKIEDRQRAIIDVSSNPVSSLGRDAPESSEPAAD